MINITQAKLEEMKARGIEYLLVASAEAVGIYTGDVISSHKTYIAASKAARGGLRVRLVRIEDAINEVTR